LAGFAGKNGSRNRRRIAGWAGCRGRGSGSRDENLT
jgi:hypothetical protein